MTAFRLLIVEDNQQELETCRASVERYMHEKERQFELVECKTVAEAISKLDNSFDGAIIDLRLDEGESEGNRVVHGIRDAHLRIPVAILTGTPDNANADFAYVGVFKKGDRGASYSDLLDRFWDIHNTGITRIMGGRGKIEEALNTVFHQNLQPQNERWIEYGRENPSRTEKSLLRLTLSHLLQLLDDDENPYLPEEVYLAPPLSPGITTGSIVSRKGEKQTFVVLSPACDLVVRENGRCNTDHVLLIEIDGQETVLPDLPAGGLSNRQKKELQSAYKNKMKNYYHWLPTTSIFAGGFMNFRKVSTLPKDGFDERFNKPSIQISGFFVKDIVARFSAYYARQGQPDIDVDRILAAL